MGKKLVIKGADFSLNAVMREDIAQGGSGVWVIDMRDLEHLVDSNANKSSGAFVVDGYEALQGKTIKKMRLIAGTSGTMSFYVGSNINASTQTAYSITVDSSNVGKAVEYDVDIPIGANDMIGIQGVNDTALIKYYKNGTEGTANFRYNCFRATQTVGRPSTPQQMIISFYCE